MILSRYERMIAKRYLLPGSGERFIFLVAAISLIAVTLGVAALIVVMSVMNGFRAELFDKIIGLNGDAVVQGYNQQLPDWREIVAEAKATPGVTSAIPIIEQPLMASFQGRVEPVLLHGMLPQDILASPTLKVSAGSLGALKPGTQNIAIGARLAEQLGAVVGDQISLISPQGRTTPFGTVPRIVSYNVVSIFEVGVYDYDKTFVLIPLEDAQNFLMMGDAVGMVKLQTNDPDHIDKLLAPLKTKLQGRAALSDWRQLNGSLFEAVQVEKVVMFVMLMIIMLVAAFNICSSLIMLVRAKSRDIAILRTMGATRSGILRIFVSVGLTIGGLGIGAGIVLGTIILFFRQSIVNFLQYVTGQNLWDPSIRFLTILPSKTDPFDVTLTIGMAIGLSFLATLYPAWKAARTDPVQVLRYD